MFCATAALAWSDAWADSQDHRLEALDLLLDLRSAGWRTPRPPTCTRAAFVASPAFWALVGHDQAWRALAVELLELVHLAVEPHLGLLLVGDDVGRLLLEPPVLVLGLGDRLLELDLGVGPLVERPG